MESLSITTIVLLIAAHLSGLEAGGSHDQGTENSVTELCLGDIVLDRPHFPHGNSVLRAQDPISATLVISLFVRAFHGDHATANQ